IVLLEVRIGPTRGRVPEMDRLPGTRSQEFAVGRKGHRVNERVPDGDLAKFFAGAQVPQQNVALRSPTTLVLVVIFRLILGAVLIAPCRRQDFPIRRKGHGPNKVPWSLEPAKFLSGVHFPDNERATAAGGQHLAIRGKSPELFRETRLEI